MRRRVLLAATLAAPFVARAQGAARIAVVGGGFGGATIARRMALAGHQVTMIESEPGYTACPLSNAVLVGLRQMEQQTFGWSRVAAAGVRIVQARATGIDTAARRVLLDGAGIDYDRLVLSPGIDLILAPEPGGVPGYDQVATVRMPHAWKAGLQTSLLREQLRAMDDGGTVVIVVPANPYRSPSGPYERASLIAWYLKANKPRSKVIVLDGKDEFGMQALFRQAWAALYKDNLEWVGLSGGGKVTAVDSAAMTVTTAHQTYKAAVACVIPPQRAGSIALAAGVADSSGWCPVDVRSFRSARIPNTYVIGDAAIMGAMPKTAFAAAVQAKTCADAMAAELAGSAPDEPRLMNASYSLAAPDYGFSDVRIYRPSYGQLTEVPDAGGPSPLDATPAVRAQEATYDKIWFETITGSVFG